MEVEGRTKVFLAPTVLSVKSEVKSPSFSLLAIEAARAIPGKIVEMRILESILGVF